MKTNLLLPGLQFLDQEVVALGDFAQLGVHATLQVDKVLPSFHSIARVLVALAHNLVEMTHRYLGHQRLLDRTTKDGLHAGVAALKFHAISFILFDLKSRIKFIPVSRKRDP
jgi:predicted ferric reductase